MDTSISITIVRSLRTPTTQAKGQAHGSENAYNTNIVSRTKGFVLVLVLA